jgi:hypothetical protein
MLINQARRLVRDLGYDNRVWVVVENDADMDLGYCIYFVDTTTHQRLKVDPERIQKFYEQQRHQDLSDLSPT